MDLIGKTIGKYRVLTEIGRGGMGTVYQGYDPTLDRMVAIKVLSAALATDESFVRRFQLEARSIARLDHPHIVSIFDAGTINNTPYLVMEYLEDGSLAQLIERDGPLFAEQITSYMLQIGSALDYAHTQGFVHRDVKPSNILLNPRGWAELTDFGLVKNTDVQITMAGQSMGTPTYMSPEQIQNDDVGPRSDIYSLGVVAYEAIGGTPPFGGSMSQVFDGHVRREPPPLRSANNALPPAVEPVIRKALSKRPDDRYPTATAFANALGAAFQAPAPTTGDAPTAVPKVSPTAAPAIAPALASTATALDTPAPQRAALFNLPSKSQSQETSMTSTPPPGQQPPYNPHQGQPNQTPSYGQPNQTPNYGQGNQTPAYGQGFQQGQQSPQYGGPQPQYGGPPQRPPRSKLPWILGGLAGILGVTVLGLLAFILGQGVTGSSDPSPSPSQVAVASPSASPSASDAPSDAAAPAASGSADASAAASGSAAPSGSAAAGADGSPAASAAASASPSASAGVGAIANLQDVKQATVQIVAQGTFRDPEQEITNAFGSGTGFIIDGSGLAVTNNHVVTGAGTLDVFVAGETQPRAARVIAASECADLALIDIDGDNYPYLEWSDVELEPTVEVYAAGFPLGEPTYSATRGSINKVQADRATSWALVASEIVHDANINPGNSGGPLVDKDGKVVGVNYAVDKEADQNFAIAREEALRVIDELKKGTDVRSIGVNGTAIVSEDGSLSGIWVASVKSGSPADKARIRAGDIITSLEGIELATDGSMLDYCKVLRGRQPTDTLSVEVLRLDESAVYEGQINGRELAQVTSFAQIAEQNGETTEEQPVASYSGYRTVQDDNRVIQVNIPNEWSEVDGRTWEVDGEALGVQITAAPSIERFNQTYDEPGIIFVASRAVAQVYNENEVLALFDLTADCTKTQSAQPYEDDLYSGVYDYYENCDGGTTEAVVLTFVPDTRAYVGIVAIQLTSEADYEALDQILASFEVIGTFTD